MKRGLIALAAVASAFALAPLANATPIPVKAFYMYASGPRGLQHVGYYDGKRYAEKQPAGTDRVLMLDFGAARKVDSDTWGTLGFAGTYFTNGDILLALERAADGYHDGNSSGRVLITLRQLELPPLGQRDGLEQHVVRRLLPVVPRQATGGLPGVEGVQPRGSRRRKRHGAVLGRAGGDAAARERRHGARLRPLLQLRLGRRLSVDGEQRELQQRWDVGDAGYVSYHGMGWGLPEIYYTVNADQWTVIRRAWEASHSDDFLFAGVTAGGALAPQTAWNALAARNPYRVLDELICFC